jgi:hypothetical protein
VFFQFFLIQFQFYPHSFDPNADLFSRAINQRLLVMFSLLSSSESCKRTDPRSPVHLRVFGLAEVEDPCSLAELACLPVLLLA